MKMWFERLVGFKEVSLTQVKSNLIIEGDGFISKVNNKKFYFGQLEVPTLEYLRDNIELEVTENKRISIQKVVANVQELHSNVENSNAVFQAASQFNLLEMINPEITPEHGVARYENDYTQGPACAIACGAGTIYRNYFLEVNNKIGQTSTNQIDCLDLIGIELKNDDLGLWTMKNGYALASKKGLLTINNKLATLSDKLREDLKGKLKIGIQWNTEVTLSEEKHRVTQVYCAALPVAYSNIEPYYWESFSRLILEATYEATLYASLKNMEKYGSNVVFLTLVGGGAFGNEQNWIFESLEKALLKFKNIPLDVRIVSFHKSNPELDSFINKIKNMLKNN